MRSWTLVVLSLVALPFVMGSGCEEDGAPPYVAPRCLRHPGTTCGTGVVEQEGQPPVMNDAYCSDDLFCNGEERCMPGSADADGCGCIAAPTPAGCSADQVCNEALDRCEACGTDADGDGHRSPACGGDDCDDNDAMRFPGNPEVCDGNDHDEDCDSTTFGVLDGDGDQFNSAACCNPAGNDGVVHCGTDCDDTNPAVVPGAQVCQKGGATNVIVCQSNGMPSAPIPCGGALTCVTQPNGLGVCE